MRSAILVLMLLLTACAGGDPTISAPSSAPTPEATASPTPEATATPTPTPMPSPTPDQSETPDVSVTYFGIRDNAGRLWVEPVTATAPAGGSADPARAAFDALLAGPRTGEVVTLAPAGTDVLEVTTTGGELTLELSQEVTTNPGAGAEAEEAFVQSLAHTAATLPGVTALRILVAGQPIDTLWGHADLTAAIEPDEFAISPIILSDVAATAGEGPGTGTIIVSGSANTFEAVFELELQDASGAVLASPFTMATCGSGCRGDWSQSFDGLDAGTYTVVAREEDISGEGRPVFTISREINVP